MTKWSHWNICSVTWALAVGTKVLTEKSYHLCKSLFPNVLAKILDLQPSTEMKEHLLFLLPWWVPTIYEGCIFLTCSMLVPPEWTSALIWIRVFWTMYLRHDTKIYASRPRVNFRDLSVKLCLSRAQWNHQKGGHPGKRFLMTNTISMMPAYTSSVPEVAKFRYTWIFCVFGTEPNTNLKANRSLC